MPKTIKKRKKNVPFQVTKHTILIVEDGNLNYVLLKKLIQKIIPFGCAIHRAENGKIAVDFCKNNDNIDMVLMDIQMPIMDGFEATKRIKKKYPDLPIIAQSAYTSLENQIRAKEVGCNDFIFKPLQRKHVEKVINSYIMA